MIVVLPIGYVRSKMLQPATHVGFPDLPPWAMATMTLLSLFPKPEDVLALTPEDPGGVVIELMPPLL